MIRRVIPIIAGAVALIAAIASSSSSWATSSNTQTGLATVAAQSSLVAQAKAVVVAAEKPITTWHGPTSSPKPAKGKTVYVISCSPDTEGCQRDVRAAVQAAKTIGWTVKRLDSDGTVANFVSLMDQAINAGANGIIVASFPPAAFPAPLQLAASKHIPVVTMLSGATPPAASSSFTGGYFTEVDTDPTVQGRLAADWIIWKTNAHAVIGDINEPAFPILGERIAGFKAVFARCSGCSIKQELDVPVADIASQAAPAVASFLQANPDVNYFWSTYDGAAVFAVQAVHQVGLAGKLSMISIDGNAVNLSYIRTSNVQVADVVAPHEWIGWAAVDQMNRAFNHKPPAPQWAPGGGGIPTKFLVKSNLPANKAPFTGDFNYQAQFKKLWGK